MADLPMIFFAGMGADERVFGPQIARFPQLVVPKWIEPEGRETLGEYARRFARAIDPGGPCIVGGASFGGFAAIESARYLQARACVLIGSARGPDELPPHIRALGSVAQLLPFVPFEWAAPAAAFANATSGWAMPAASRNVLRQLSDAQGRFLRWASVAVLRWRASSPPLACPVHHIHGGRDHVLPARYTHAEVILPTAGHVLSLTHGEQVNAFIEERIAVRV